MYPGWLSDLPYREDLLAKAFYGIFAEMNFAITAVLRRFQGLGTILRAYRRHILFDSYMLDIWGISRQRVSLVFTRRRISARVLQLWSRPPTILTSLPVFRNFINSAQIVNLYPLLISRLIFYLVVTNIKMAAVYFSTTLPTRWQGKRSNIIINLRSPWIAVHCGIEVWNRNTHGSRIYRLYSRPINAAHIATSSVVN